MRGSICFRGSPEGERDGSNAREGHVERHSVTEALAEVAARLNKAKSLKKATIVFRATGPGGGDFRSETDPKGVKFVRDAPATDLAPTIEIMGDAPRIRAALSGDKDPRALSSLADSAFARSRLLQRSGG